MSVTWESGTSGDTEPEFTSVHTSDSDIIWFDSVKVKQLARRQPIDWKGLREKCRALPRLIHWWRVFGIGGGSGNTTHIS